MILPTHLTKYRRSLSMLTAVCVLSIGWTGCLQNYARFSRDAEISDAFRSGSVAPELSYFFAGREDMPYAILGIEPGYRNSSPLWIAFEPRPETLRKMSANIYGKDRYDPYGYHILAPDGTVVGIWFSSLHFPSVRVDQQNRTVDVLYRSPEVYREY